MHVAGKAHIKCKGLLPRWVLKLSLNRVSLFLWLYVWLICIHSFIAEWNVRLTDVYTGNALFWLIYWLYELKKKNLCLWVHRSIANLCFVTYQYCGDVLSLTLIFFFFFFNVWYGYWLGFFPPKDSAQRSSVVFNRTIKSQRFLNQKLVRWDLPCLHKWCCT